jgi:hypothetical protein
VKQRLSYANVIATLALFVALGGAAWAGTRLPKNSVGAKQVRKNAVTTPKIKNEAVTAGKIRKGTIDGSRLNLTTIGTVPSAKSAGDAQTLGGAAPATYLDRVAQATANGLEAHFNGAIDATPGSGPLSISVPAGVGYVVVDGAASFAEASTLPATMELWVQEDEPCAEKGLGWENEMFGSLVAGGNRAELSQHLVFPVGPGTHNYRLCLRSSSEMEAFSRTLSAMTVPRGGAGSP